MKISRFFKGVNGIILIFIVTFLTGGCQTTYRVNPDFVASDDLINPIDITVQLHLSDDFLTKTVEGVRITTPYDTVQFGPALSDNSIKMVRSLFRKVVITRGGKLKIMDGVDATLEPRFESLAQTYLAMTIYDTVTLSWVLKDRHNIKIWADTLGGSTQSWGFGPSLAARHRKGIHQALNLSFTNAAEAINSSIKIYRFAERKK